LGDGKSGAAPSRPATLDDHRSKFMVTAMSSPIFQRSRGVMLDQFRQSQRSPAQESEVTFPKIRHDEERGVQILSEHGAAQLGDLQSHEREQDDHEAAENTALQVLATVAGQVQEVEHRLGQQLEQRMWSLTTIMRGMQDTMRGIEDNVHQRLAPVLDHISRSVTAQDNVKNHSAPFLEDRNRRSAEGVDPAASAQTRKLSLPLVSRH